jgi:ribosomal protein S27AE
MEDAHAAVDADVPTCPRCGCPFFMSMRHRVTGRWAAQCNACGFAFYLDGPREEICRS